MSDESCELAEMFSQEQEDAVGSAPELEFKVTDEQFQFVKTNLGSGYSSMPDCTEATIKRFIRATQGDLELSIKRLQTTLQWRLENNPALTVCKACLRDPRSHYLHVVGFCKQNRPVIYSCMAMAKDREIEDNRDHMVQTFEMAVRCMPPGVEQWVWFCDFEGFGLGDCNPKLAQAFLELSSSHYPERLGIFLMVDAPAIFKSLWKVMKPLIDPRTFKKIRFLPYDLEKEEKKKKKALKGKDHPGSSLLKGLNDLFEPSTVAWLIQEMEENRDKKKREKKTYTMSDIYHKAQSGDLSSSMANLSLKHDHHGHHDLLRAYASSPDLLLPQGKASLA